MKSEIQQVKSFNFTKISCNSCFGNIIIQLRVVRHRKKCLFGLFSFANATRTPHGDSNFQVLWTRFLVSKCNPHPSRGRQLEE